MNYITLIRDFWRSHEEHSFSTTEIALYFHLVEVCNICHWKNPFKRNNSKIGADLGISFNTLKNARNKLAQCGLITFKTQNGNSNVTYTLLKFDEVSNKVGDEVSNKVGDEVLPTKDKPNQTKPNESIIINNSLPRFSNEEIISLENLENEIYGYEILWIEQTAMRNKLNHEEIHNYLKEFFLKLTCEGEEMKSKKDFKKHFNNWVKAELKEKSKKNKSHAQVYHTNGKYEEF